MTCWTPRPDQQAVLDFILPRDRAAVWAGTGVGKTAIGLTWLDWRMNQEFCTGRALVVCPPLVVDGWVGQMRRWDQFGLLGRDVRLLTSKDFGLVRDSAKQLVLGDKAAVRRRLLEMRERLTIVPWSMWPFLVKALQTWFPFNDVVFDESSNLRDGGSERGKAARYVVHKLDRATGVLQLTATPSANHEEAIYAQVALLERGLLGATLTEFRDTYCEPATRNWQTGQVYSYKIAERSRAEFERRVATVAVSVPSNLGVPLLRVEQSIGLPEAARGLYETLERVWTVPGITCGSEAVLHTKLRQIASGTVYRDDKTVLRLHDTKFERLQELIESIGEPVVVGYEWKSELQRLQDIFGPKVADIRESHAKAAFLAGDLPVLAIEPQSAAHGVDGLQAVSRNVLWLTVPQDLELELQLNGRLHRTGTNADTVFAHYLIAEDTVERRIYDDVLPGKMTLQELVLSRTRVRPI